MKFPSIPFSFAVLTLVLAAAPAHAQFHAIFRGATEAINQVGSKIGTKVMGADQPKDLQAERDAYFANADKQTAGMDPATKVQIMNTLNLAWSGVERSVLLANAQAQAAKDAPWLDFTKIAKEAAGGMATQIGIGAIGSSGVGDLLGSATMDGVINGMGGRSASASIAAAQMNRPTRASTADVGSALGAGMQAGATQAVVGGVSNAVGSAVSGLMGKVGFGGPKEKEFEVTDAVSTTLFFGKHPAQVEGKDLYRENGFLGWQRIDVATDKSAEAYAPITGQGPARASVFNINLETGKVVAAFRVLNAKPAEFTKVVEAYTKKTGSEPRFSSSGSVLRAVWQCGSFVTADETRLSAGWSVVAGQTFSDLAAAAGTPVAAAPVATPAAH